MLLMVQNGIVTLVAERLSDFKIAKAILSPFLRPTVKISMIYLRPQDISLFAYGISAYCYKKRISTL